MVRARAALGLLLSALMLSVPLLAAAQQRAPVATAANAAAGVVSAIRVEGNHRIDASTIRSYMLIAAGDPYDASLVNASLKALYATGLFSNVSIGREGSALVVRVEENPTVNEVAFEGNHKLTDDNLRSVTQLRPRAVFTAAAAEADRERILAAYAGKARFGATVTPEIIKLPNNRVNVVFKINDGNATLISRIVFVGNKAFSEGTLRDVIASRETAWWRFLSSADIYDPKRLDYDKELLRRFYLRHGYADFGIKDASADLTADRSAFFLTFTLHEGERYRVSAVEIHSSLANFPPAKLKPMVELGAGDWYDGDAVERSVQAITAYAQHRGQAFIRVQPEVQRDPAKHSIVLRFDVTEGPRVWVERINITGNTRTEDKVIRRQFLLAEGDAFNAALLRQTRQRLQDLDYFSSVDLTDAPGSAQDRAIVNTKVQEKSTGSLTVGGGYSTDIGALVNFGIRERNLVGTGLDTGISATLAQKESQVDLSLTDPYFLDRNIVVGTDIFLVNTTNFNQLDYNERRAGFSLRAGYEINAHLRQVWSYALVHRSIYNIQPGASLFVINEAGQTLLSQVGQAVTLDYTDSRLDPRKGWLVRLGTDFAGVGGDAHFVRTKVDGAYYIPLEQWFGSDDWDLSFRAGTGYLFTLGEQEKIIDRFFLGGANLRGFETAGVGPHSVPTAAYPSADSLGGRFIWTQSTELRFPLPVSPDLGISGRTFVDFGGLSGVGPVYLNGVRQPFVDSSAPRMGTGFGVSWKTPFGLINIDIAEAVLKQKYDTTQLVRFGFGTRF